MTEEKITEAGMAAHGVLSGEQAAGRLVRENLNEGEAIEAALDKRAMWRTISRRTRPQRRRGYWVAAAARRQRLTLQVPRGVAPLSVVLGDGSTVWLNSGSQLNYPACFESTRREVELIGEAFFEVAHDARHPFVVRAGAMTATVLGTTFNVSAYADDPAVAATLVEGSVRVDTEGGASQVLTPSMQASLSQQGGLMIRHVDVAAAVAWRDGVMVLDETDLQQIMRVLSRWYDIDVEYADGAAQEQHNFTARLCRAEGLSRALETLEMLGAPEIEVTENTLIIHQ